MDTKDVINIVQKCTDEVLALTVVCGTMASYYVGVVMPVEPMIMVLGFYFVKRSLKNEH